MQSIKLSAVILLPCNMRAMRANNEKEKIIFEVRHRVIEWKAAIPQAQPIHLRSRIQY